MKEVSIYTDGACRGNPGRGGWGAILVYGKYEKELSGGERETTNNRMELTAAIEGLSALREPCKVTLYSDSKYVVDAFLLGWVESWRAAGWRKILYFCLSKLIFSLFSLDLFVKDSTECT